MNIKVIMIMIIVFTVFKVSSTLFPPQHPLLLPCWKCRYDDDGDDEIGKGHAGDNGNGDGAKDGEGNGVGDADANSK